MASLTENNVASIIRYLASGDFTSSELNATCATLNKTPEACSQLLERLFEHIAQGEPASELLTNTKQLLTLLSDHDVVGEGGIGVNGKEIKKVEKNEENSSENILQALASGRNIDKLEDDFFSHILPNEQHFSIEEIQQQIFNLLADTNNFEEAFSMAVSQYQTASDSILADTSISAKEYMLTALANGESISHLFGGFNSSIEAKLANHTPQYLNQGSSTLSDELITSLGNGQSIDSALTDALTATQQINEAYNSTSLDRSFQSGSIYQTLLHALSSGRNLTDSLADLNIDGKLQSILLQAMSNAEVNAVTLEDMLNNIQTETDVLAGKIIGDSIRQSSKNSKNKSGDEGSNEDENRVYEGINEETNEKENKSTEVSVTDILQVLSSSSDISLDAVDEKQLITILAKGHELETSLKEVQKQTIELAKISDKIQLGIGDKSLLSTLASGKELDIAVQNALDDTLSAGDSLQSNSAGTSKSAPQLLLKNLAAGAALETSISNTRAAILAEPDVQVTTDRTIFLASALASGDGVAPVLYTLDDTDVVPSTTLFQTPLESSQSAAYINESLQAFYSSLLSSLAQGQSITASIAAANEAYAINVAAVAAVQMSHNHTTHYVNNHDASAKRLIENSVQLISENSVDTGEIIHSQEIITDNIDTTTLLTQNLVVDINVNSSQYYIPPVSVDVFSSLVMNNQNTHNTKLFQQTTFAPPENTPPLFDNIDRVFANRQPSIDDLIFYVSEDSGFINAQLSVEDSDISDNHEFIFSNLPTVGIFNSDFSGIFNFRFDFAYQMLNDGQEEIMRFSYRVLDDSGEVNASSRQGQVTVIITGEDDVPFIEGDDSASLQEDMAAVLQAQGQLIIRGGDAGEQEFIAQNINGHYGVLSIAADGTWLYRADNNQEDLQTLLPGDILSETFTVTNTDGVTEQSILITINGRDDTPIISGNISARLHDGVSRLLLTSGELTAQGGDRGEEQFIATSLIGEYGEFSINVNGQWHYSADSSQTAIQQLPENAVLIDRFTVTNSDGVTTEDISITIEGRDNVPVIVGSVAGSIREDDASILSSRGDLNALGGDVGEDQFVAATYNGSYGQLSIDVDGQWHYRADSLQTAIQQLPENAVLIDLFTVTNSDGVTTEDISITIEGRNDVPVIAGTIAGSVTEDDAAILSVGGQLYALDGDLGEDQFIATTLVGNYGQLSIYGSGEWIYGAANSQAAIQALSDGQTLTEIFTVTNMDGVTTQAITITINGNNNIPVITGDTSALVMEDDGPTLITSGNLISLGGDAGEGEFISDTNRGAYGEFSINTAGEWTYTADNNLVVIQDLAPGQSLVETFSVTNADGVTTQDISITINGNDDVPIITGDVLGIVIEDTATTLMTMGSLDITGGDLGENQFNAETLNGIYGTLTISAQGQWQYQAANSQAAIQALAPGHVLTETFTLISGDGVTTEDITISINGNDDIPIITGDISGAITEDDAVTLISTGALNANGGDAGEDQFTPVILTGIYGELEINQEGEWIYEADNAQTAIQALTLGQTLTDTLTVANADGMTTQDIVITIYGSNDIPLISGDTSGEVFEDAANTLQVRGRLYATGGDAGEDEFIFQGFEGEYGILIMYNGGGWHYLADNTQSAIQQLNLGETLTEHFTVTNADGVTTASIDITIHGVDEDNSLRANMSNPFNITIENEVIREFESKPTVSSHMLLSHIDADDKENYSFHGDFYAKANNYEGTEEIFTSDDFIYSGFSLADQPAYSAI
ncbi:VCBS domain-containing protein [Agarilytica rhodophyticola]|uniref:VCBS domain-containing protein n=1 Tax=Agarilytica rhodophyticola TaxID=1737490 RepID=UPI000B3470A5|nr:VCBS domain-containing protein [Agarilytica rhodophyticola]